MYEHIYVSRKANVHILGECATICIAALSVRLTMRKNSLRTGH